LTKLQKQTKFVGIEVRLAASVGPALARVIEKAEQAGYTTSERLEFVCRMRVAVVASKVSDAWQLHQIVEQIDNYGIAFEDLTGRA
jgi:hypothetical protein